MRFDGMPLVVLARRPEDGQATLRRHLGSRPVQVVTHDVEELLKLQREGFLYTFASPNSPPTLEVWAAAVERGIPLGDMK